MELETYSCPVAANLVADSDGAAGYKYQNVTRHENWWTVCMWVEAVVADGRPLFPRYRSKRMQTRKEVWGDDWGTVGRRAFQRSRRSHDVQVI